MNPEGEREGEMLPGCLVSILIPSISGLMSHLRVIAPTTVAVFSFLTMSLFLATEPLCYGPVDLEVLPQIQPWRKFKTLFNEKFSTM